MPRARLQFAFLMLVLGAVLVREAQQDPLQEFDARFATLLARLHPTQLPPPPLTLVEINDDSLRQHPWPWSPLDFALFFQAASAFHPTVIATDEVFSWHQDHSAPQPKLPQYKKILRDHLLKSPKVLLGTQLGIPEDPQVVPPLQEMPLVRNVHGDTRLIPEFTAIGSQPEDDFRLSSEIGVTNVPEHKAAHRRIPLLLRYRGQVVPTLPLQLVAIHERISLDELTVELGSRIRVADRFAIPINALGEMPLDPSASLTRQSFDDLLLASSQIDSKSPSSIATENLEGRMLLLTRTDSSSRTLQTPASGKFSAGELMAAGVTTILTRSFPPERPAWSDWAIVAAAVLLAAAASHAPPRSCVTISLSALAAYCGIATLLFASTRIAMPAALPLGLMAFLVCFRPLLQAAPAPSLQTTTPASPQAADTQTQAPETKSAPEQPQPPATRSQPFTLLSSLNKALEPTPQPKLAEPSPNEAPKL